MNSTPVRSILITSIAALCCTVTVHSQDNAPSTPKTTPSTSGQSGSQTGDAQSGNSQGSTNQISPSQSSAGTSSGVQATDTASMQSSTGSANSSSTAAQDKMFLANSAEGSMAEIELSMIALKKTKNDEVKSYAQQMITDHTKLIADMKPFADQMGVQPPKKLKPAHQQEAQRLRAMSGAKLDKEYITAMVANHHKDLGEFQSEESSTANPDLKTTVAQGEQVVKQHTDMIDSMAQKNSISTPPMPAM